jgi:hypothetical protein
MLLKIFAKNDHNDIVDKLKYVQVCRTHKHFQDGAAIGVLLVVPLLLLLSRGCNNQPLLSVATAGSGWQ